MTTDSPRPAEAPGALDLRVARRVIVPVDATPASISALVWLIDHGRLQEGQLRLVTIEAGGVSRAGVEQALLTASGLTPRHRSWLAEAPWYSVTAARLFKSAAAAILRTAGPEDIVVVGGRPATATREAVVGSLPLRLSAVSRVPVVVVPEDLSPVATETIHLLVGEEDESDEPLRYAATEALLHGVPLQLLHGWHVAPLYPLEDAASSAAYDHLGRAAHETLEAAHERAQSRYPTLQVRSQVLEGPVPRVLLRELGRGGIAVVGRRGAGTVRQVLLGSVALDLIAALPCPVAVVPLEPWRSALT